MKTVADRAIPFLLPSFAGVGRLHAVAGRDIDRELVRDADLLIVRTITTVDESLLRGSSVRFVASPTAGIDHVDTAWLAAANIGFAHAPGCNARAVAEYVLSSLFVLAELRGFDPAGIRVGIVGCGHAGSQLGRFLDALGIEHLDCDPPLQRAGRPGRWHELADLRQVDVISLHVPLTDSGPHPTRGLIDAGFLAGLRDDAVLINAARGGIIDEPALLDFLTGRPRAACVIDTWAGEPDPSPALLRRADIGTPHIAGYSLDARLRATRAVSHAAREYFGLPGLAAPPPLPEPSELRIGAGQKALDAVRYAVLAGYDVRSDAAALRRGAGADSAGRAALFADLRNNYPVRREFPAFLARIPRGAPRLGHMLDGIGFRVAGTD